MPPRKKTTEKPTPAPSPEDVPQGAMEWARAVMWAFENMHQPRITKAKAGNALNYTMWKSAKDYPKEMLVNLMPKAMQIFEKHKADADPSGIAVAEEASILELRELLKAAVEEAREVG